MPKRRRKTGDKEAGYPTVTPEQDVRSYGSHGLYRKIDLSTLDGRTKLGKAAKEIKADLEAYVGAGNIVTNLLIQQITYKVLRLRIYQGNNFDNPKDLEAAHFLPMANSLRLDLDALAKLAGQSKPPSLEDYLKKLEEAK